jgi:hypothetical protein
VDRKTRALALIAPALVTLAVAGLAGLAVQSTAAQGRSASVPAPAAASHRFPPPVSAADGDPGLADLRDRIRRAVDARAFEPLVPLMSPSVYYDLGESFTPAEFLAESKTWSSAQAAEFWRDLHDALALPIGAAGDTAYASYVALVRVPQIEWKVATARGVKVRQAPSLSAPVVAELDYDMVEDVTEFAAARTLPPVRIGGFSYGWLEIVTPAGARGWVVAKDVHSPRYLPVVFKKTDGVWKIRGLCVTSD